MLKVATDTNDDGVVDGSGFDTGRVTGGNGYPHLPTVTPVGRRIMKDTVSVACLVDADGDGVFSDVDTDDSNLNVC